MVKYKGVCIEQLFPSGYYTASVYVEGWFNGLNGVEWSSGRLEWVTADTLDGLKQLVDEVK